MSEDERRTRKRTPRVPATFVYERVVPLVIVLMGVVLVVIVIAIVLALVGVGPTY